MTDIPRRAYVDRMTAEERAIRVIILEVEELGAHPLLTETVNLLHKAKDKLSDWVDLPENQPDHK